MRRLELCSPRHDHCSRYWRCILIRIDTLLPLPHSTAVFSIRLTAVVITCSTVDKVVRYLRPVDKAMRGLFSVRALFQCCLQVKHQRYWHFISELIHGWMLCA
jgi:hypothetical protein